MARGSTYRRRRPDGSWGRWHAVIDLPRVHGGSRRQVTRTFDTQREAHAWLAHMNSRAGKPGEPGVACPVLVSDWLHTWLEDQPLTRASTLATQRGHVERHLVPTLGDRRVAEVSAQDVQELVHALLARGLAPATVARIIATLQSAFTAAVRAGKRGDNPARGARLPTVPAPVRDLWSLADAQRFLATCRGTGVEVLWRLALVTGMRRGELLGLNWADLDRAHACLQVRTTRTYVAGEVVTGTPKSGHGRRAVYLDTTTLGFLRRWELTQARWLGVQDGWVFTHINGEPFAPAWVSRQFTTRITELGLPVIRFHDLRHVSAILGLSQGESLLEVSRRLGHADISITAGVYGGILPATARASAQRRGAALAPEHPFTTIQEVS